MIAASLDLSSHELLQICDDQGGSGQLIEILEADQWFEADTKSLRAAHDVFSDALVAQYLFEEGRSTQLRLADVLSDCQRLGALARCLGALDRLANHRAAGRLQLLPALRQLHDRDESALATAAVAILRSRLLLPAEILQLIALDLNLSRTIELDREADGLVSRLAKAVAESSDSDFRERALPVLSPLLEAALLTTQRTNMVLRRAFELLPDVYGSRVKIIIEKNAVDHQSHYLIASYLRLSSPEEWLREAAFIWLKRWSSTARKASFVIAEWLRATGEVEYIRTDLRLWLARYCCSEEATHVYKSWLDAGGGVETIGSEVRAWLDVHRTLIDASHVYQSWLNAGGGIESVAADVRAWLDQHRTAIEARFVYKSWLDARGGLSSIASDMRAWLGRPSISNRG